MNFNTERFGFLSGALSNCRICLQESIFYAKNRKTFGKRLIIDHQVSKCQKL